MKLYQFTYSDGQNGYIRANNRLEATQMLKEKGLAENIVRTLSIWNGY